MSNLKTCRECDRDLPLSDFHLNGSGGHKGICKRCDHWLQLSKRRESVVRYERYRSWSALDDARLLALMAIGLKPKDVVGIVGRSRTVIEHRLRVIPSAYPNAKIDLARRVQQHDPELIKRIRSLRGVMSNRDMANHLGLSSGQVAGIIHRHIRNGKPSQPGMRIHG